MDSMDPAAPLQPTYSFNPSSGYDRHNDLDPGVEGGEYPEDANKDPDIASQDETDSEDYPNILDDEIMVSNPSDYTKSYNRQRHIQEAEVAIAQLPKTNSQQKPKANLTAQIDDQVASLSRHATKLKLDDQAAGLKDGSSGLGLQRSDRATTEQVLDPRTRLILLKMINQGLLSEIHGCISTGKEANVYYALQDSQEDPGKPKHLAVKIYKTSILRFKDRSKYVSGEFRFQRGFPKRSNRGMVRLWAEKEFRNLKRMHAAGLPVPEPIYLKSHVLVMSFIGRIAPSGHSIATPPLRDCDFREQDDVRAGELWYGLYRRTVIYMRAVYRTCKLVHADLSEYNILYDQADSHLTMIDVSQSVEHDHPRSLDFLRMDIKNITEFFSRRAVATLTEPSVFHFITREKNLQDPEGIEKLLDDLQNDPVQPDADAEVFRQQNMPQALDQIEVTELPLGNTIGDDENSALQDLLADDRQVPKKTPEREGEGALESKSSHVSQESEAISSSASDSESDSQAKKSEGQGLPRGHRFEDRTVKAQRKAAVKEEKRERRKTKIPKHVKRKLVNHSSRNSKK